MSNAASLNSLLDQILFGSVSATLDRRRVRTCLFDMQHRVLIAHGTDSAIQLRACPLPAVLLDPRHATILCSGIVMMH
jgi:hypothetical protein